MAFRIPAPPADIAEENARELAGDLNKLRNLLAADILRGHIKRADAARIYQERVEDWKAGRNWASRRYVRDSTP